mmetsp:Transcript_39183/g.94156  ORF Transcript_39183/g.94156 Transcript_39183/m.94156 type:complete len:235 (-) Transcript_39183:610-1314(-)
MLGDLVPSQHLVHRQPAPGLITQLHGGVLHDVVVHDRVHPALGGLGAGRILELHQIGPGLVGEGELEILVANCTTPRNKQLPDTVNLLLGRTKHLVHDGRRPMLLQGNINTMAQQPAILRVGPCVRSRSGTVPVPGGLHRGLRVKAPANAVDLRLDVQGPPAAEGLDDRDEGLVKKAGLLGFPGGPAGCNAGGHGSHRQVFMQLMPPRLGLPFGDQRLPLASRVHVEVEIHDRT